VLDAAAYPILASMPTRPEYLIPVLFSESGLRPDVQNSLGYAGLNQISPSYLASWGIDPADYLTWPASRQLQLVVKPYLQNVIDRYGPLNSGTRTYQANFLPATLATARSLSSVLATRGSDVYDANSGFDTAGKGTITVQDLANFVAKAAAAPAVKNAIAKTYAVSGGSPRDPVYGTDFMKWTPAKVIVAAAAAGVIAWGYHEGLLQQAWQRWRMTARRWV